MKRSWDDCDKQAQMDLLNYDEVAEHDEAIKAEIVMTKSFRGL